MYEKVKESPANSESPTDELDRLRLETEAILSTSAMLVKQVEELLEECRQLRAAQTALLEQRKKDKDQK